MSQKEIVMIMIFQSPLHCCAQSLEHNVTEHKPLLVDEIAKEPRDRRLKMQANVLCRSHGCRHIHGDFMAELQKFIPVSSASLTGAPPYGKPVITFEHSSNSAQITVYLGMDYNYSGETSQL